jgi:hypothetical protein
MRPVPRSLKPKEPLSAARRDSGSKRARVARVCLTQHQHLLEQRDGRRPAVALGLDEQIAAALCLASCVPSDLMVRLRGAPAAFVSASASPRR